VRRRRLPLGAEVKWARTWPASIPPGRSYVTDQLPRIVMDGDYRPVLASLEQDTVITEWDLAVSLEDMLAFTAACEADPGTVRVAPYRLYHRKRDGQPVPVWAHQSAWHYAPLTGRHIGDGEPACDWFGLGLAYLPLAVVQKFLASGPARPVTDKTFSQWHHDAGLGPVPVEWGVRPVHLHYELPGA